MTTKLRISVDGAFALPLDAVTQTFGVLAVRGAGKSNLGAVMAEQMFAAGLPFVVIDPVGSWWGLRSSADGKGKGLAILIFGGRHGDVPLERTGGALIADLVVDQRLTCVLDVSELSEGDKVRFLIDFAERLYRRNTEPLHLFLEEADDFIPQKPFREQARLLGAWENIVRRGRARGLGMTMITQRSAAINKNVLTQIETLFVLRTTSPQDRAAIQAWVDYQGGARDMLATLPKLESGEAWVWSPSWLRVFERVRVLRRSTFDSGATPKSVKGARPAATLADVDLGAVRTAMAETIERAKAEDPKVLRSELATARKRITELEKSPAPKAETKTVEVPALSAADRKALERSVAQLDDLVGRADKLGAGLVAVVDAMRERVGEARTLSDVLSVALAPPAPTAHAHALALRNVADRRAAQPRRNAAPAGSGAGVQMPRADRALLAVLAQRSPNPATKEQLSVLSGYSVKSSSFANALGALRSAGYAEGGGDAIRITESGFKALGSYDVPPQGDELRAWWRSKLDKAERALLDTLAAEYPAALTKEELSERSGYSITSSSFANALGKLRTLELVNRGADVRASAELFG